MPRKLSIAVEELLSKAKQSALLAVEIFNKPTAEFRVQTFVMLMHTAWNSLFLAIFHNNGRKPFYKQDNGYFYIKVDGEKKAWDLSKCIKEYWKSETNPVRENLNFFIKLRNKIEHYRDQATLTKLTFGECQSLVTNFGKILVEEFGAEHSLVGKLSLSIQLSGFKDVSREDAILSAVDKRTRKITRFIEDFRSSLSDDIFSDMRFSHKLFLLPKTANHQSRESVAIEWVNTDDLSSEELEEVEKISAIIKRKQVEVKNLGKLSPTDVCNRIKNELGFEDFSPSWHHAQCWRYFEVRPESDANEPENCKTQYCQYDAAHGDYVYTDKWVEFLIEKLSDPQKFEDIISYRK